MGTLTWDDISCIHGIFILDETETIHKFDLCYFACAMRVEVVFNLLFGNWRQDKNQYSPGSNVVRKVGPSRGIC